CHRRLLRDHGLARTLMVRRTLPLRGHPHRMRPAHCKLDSCGEVSRPLLQILELSSHAMASRELSHRSEVERFLLSDVDAECILEVLFAPPAELHDDRVFWRRHGESESTPGDVPPGPEGLLISRRRGG